MYPSFFNSNKCPVYYYYYYLKTLHLLMAESGKHFTFIEENFVIEVIVIWI